MKDWKLDLYHMIPSQLASCMHTCKVACDVRDGANITSMDMHDPTRQQIANINSMDMPGYGAIQSSHVRTGTVEQYMHGGGTWS